MSQTPDFQTLDLYSDAVLADPYPTYAAIRDAGAAVWLGRHQVWAVGRYADVRKTLIKNTIFISGEGIGLTPQANEAIRGAVLASDPPRHGRMRAVLNDRLSPSGLLKLAPGIQHAADALVDRLVERGSFDAVADLAKTFASSIVFDLIGVAQDVRPKALDWADAMFNCFGPPNERTMRSLPLLGEMGQYLAGVRIEHLAPGSLGAAVYEAGERGELDPQQCAALLGAYLGAGLDTTINTISAGIALFARNPDQWDLLRNNIEQAPQAFDEVLRLETPVLGFTRVASEATAIDDVAISKGDRVLVLYASANRDPRKWIDPEQFDINRDASGHIGFGIGRHVCAGQTLARMEAESLFRAMARRIERFTIEDSQPHLNNVIHGLSVLRVRTRAAG